MRDELLLHSKPHNCRGCYSPPLPCYIGSSGGANVLHDGLDPVAANARRHGREGELPFLCLQREKEQLRAGDCTYQQLPNSPRPPCTHPQAPSAGVLLVGPTEVKPSPSVF